MESRFADLRLASNLFCIGTGLLLLGLGAGIGLAVYYLYATHFGHVSDTIAARTLSEIWPWAEPVLDVEGFGVALDGLGLAMLTMQPRPVVRRTTGDVLR